MASNFNLPPGVTQNMIPGNRPEDVEYDELCEELTLISDGDLAEFVQRKMSEARDRGAKEARVSRYVLYSAPSSSMKSYVTWDGQMVDIAAPVTVEVEVRGDQKVLWVNVDGVARLRIFRIQGELTIKHQTDGRTE